MHQHEIAIDHQRRMHQPLPLLFGLTGALFRAEGSCVKSDRLGAATVAYGQVRRDPAFRSVLSHVSVSLHLLTSCSEHTRKPAD